MSYLSTESEDILRMVRSILGAMFPWLTCAPGLPRSIAQLVGYRLIPLLRSHQSHSDKAFSSVDCDHLEAVWAFLDKNKDATKLRIRQATFFVEYNLYEKCTLAGIMKLRVNEKNVHMGSCYDSNMSADYVPVHILTVINDFLKECNKGDDAEIENIQVQTPMGNIGDGAEQTDSNHNAALQTKRIPYDELQMILKEESQMGLRNGSGTVRQEVIVCASLVSKATNLGGLARTCEIFAVEKMTLGNMSVITTDAFQGVAVASGSWLPMEEVPIAELTRFLRRCKSRGYTILGLEQTDSSVSLAEYSLPSRCVLLLGKEREGIPVEFLQEVDVCIEIPQFGVTRSLNVHVSASLALWEITKQNTQFRSNASGVLSSK